MNALFISKSILLKKYRIKCEFILFTFLRKYDQCRQNVNNENFNLQSTNICTLKKEEKWHSNQPIPSIKKQKVISFLIINYERVITKENPRMSKVCVEGK